MFALNENNLKLKILSCADGPASFNSELTFCGGEVVSIDPIYQFSVDEIKKRIEETYDEILKQVRKNKGLYVWKTIHSVEELGNIRMNAMQKFLSDFETGKTEKRYITGELPTLPFNGPEFDIALCSHFLFLYSDHLSFEFHKKSIKEMLRISKEVRIFPLLSLDGKTSKYVEQIIKEFENQDFITSIATVDYEFQRGGNKMLKIRKFE